MRNRRIVLAPRPLTPACRRSYVLSYSRTWCHLSNSVYNIVTAGCRDRFGTPHLKALERLSNIRDRLFNRFLTTSGVKTSARQASPFPLSLRSALPTRPPTAVIQTPRVPVLRSRFPSPQNIATNRSSIARRPRRNCSRTIQHPTLVFTTRTEQCPSTRHKHQSSCKVGQRRDQKVGTNETGVKCRASRWLCLQTLQCQSARLSSPSSVRISRPLIVVP